MGAAVIEMLTTCGLMLVLLLMLLYMCGLYDEKSVGRLAAIFAYISSKYAKNKSILVTWNNSMQKAKSGI